MTNTGLSSLHSLSSIFKWFLYPHIHVFKFHQLSLYIFIKKVFQFIIIFVPSRFFAKKALLSVSVDTLNKQCALILFRSGMERVGITSSTMMKLYILINGDDILYFY